MSGFRFIRRLDSWEQCAQGESAQRKPARPRLALEALEERSLLSTTNVFTLPIAQNLAAERIQTLGGNLFVTTQNGGEIERITPTGQITPNFAIGGTDLAVGADGNLYTALGNTIEQITPNGTVTDFTIPTPDAFAESITASPDGNLWFEETGVDKVGRLNPTTGAAHQRNPTRIGCLLRGPQLRRNHGYRRRQRLGHPAGPEPVRFWDRADQPRRHRLRIHPPCKRQRARADQRRPGR